MTNECISICAMVARIRTSQNRSETHNTEKGKGRETGDTTADNRGRDLAYQGYHLSHVYSDRKVSKKK